jgi:hypothetical protein
MEAPLDIKIEVFTKDEEDDKYCAIVMGWDDKDWYNTGIVVRDLSPRLAFNRALKSATEVGWWK